MSECTAIKSCPFFNGKMKNMPALTEMYKKQYCLDKFSTCARYRTAQAIGKEKVPFDLYPNDSKQADSLVSNSS